VATNYRYSGKRLPVVSASADIATGLFCVQEGIFGVALTTIKSGLSGWIGAEGVWNIKVPSSTAKGNPLYASALSDSVDPTLTLTPASAFCIGVAMSDRDAAGYALVLLGPQAPTAQATPA
jgi:predicted RecA/RadA family phage recombinase